MQNNIFQWREVEIAVELKMQGYRMKKEKGKKKKIALTILTSEGFRQNSLPHPPYFVISKLFRNNQCIPLQIIENGS